MEKTFALIKPDAVAAGNAEEIAQLAEAHGFTVVEKQTIQASRTCREVNTDARCAIGRSTTASKCWILYTYICLIF